jgi:hypothetical protein
MSVSFLKTATPSHAHTCDPSAHEPPRAGGGGQVKIGDFGGGDREGSSGILPEYYPL